MYRGTTPTHVFTLPEEMTDASLDAESMTEAS